MNISQRQFNFTVCFLAVSLSFTAIFLAMASVRLEDSNKIPIIEKTISVDGKSVPAGTQSLGAIYPTNISEEWPLTIPHLNVYCYSRPHKNGFACILWGAYDGRWYALNSEANRLGYDSFVSDISAIRAQDSDGKFKDITAVLMLAEAKCGCGIREHGRGSASLSLK